MVTKYCLVILAWALMVAVQVVLGMSGSDESSGQSTRRPSARIEAQRYKKYKKYERLFRIREKDYIEPERPFGSGHFVLNPLLLKVKCSRCSHEWTMQSPKKDSGGSPPEVGEKIKTVRHSSQGQGMSSTQSTTLHGYEAVTEEGKRRRLVTMTKVETPTTKEPGMGSSSPPSLKGQGMTLSQKARLPLKKRILAEIR